jgi:hypothetical protein
VKVKLPGFAANVTAADGSWLNIDEENESFWLEWIRLENSKPIREFGLAAAKSMQKGCHAFPNTEEPKRYS